MQMASYRHLAE